MGDSILRKTDRTLSKGEDVVVSLPGARIEHVTERVENVLGHGQGESILVHVGMNSVGKEDMYMTDGLHLSGKGAAVFSENLLRSMDNGTGCNFLN